MGICSYLKQISTETLDLLKQDPALVELFITAQYLPDSACWRQSRWTEKSAKQAKDSSQNKFDRFRWSDKSERETLKQRFLNEWEISDLDLGKSWMELTFFLSGYIPGYIWSSAVPELEYLKASTLKTSPRQGWLERIFAPKQSNKNNVFLDFLVVESSEWDGLPLVNAVGAGAEIGYEMSYESMRYLESSQVVILRDYLIKLSEQGFQERFVRESEKEIRCSYIDWSDTEGLLEGMLEYYNEILNYYQDAATNKRAIIQYLT